MLQVRNFLSQRQGLMASVDFFSCQAFIESFFESFNEKRHILSLEYKLLCSVIYKAI